MSGYGDTCKYLDDRWIHLAFLMYHDAKDKNKEVAFKNLLLTPPNSSIDIRDALADVWWKLGRWMARLLKGDMVKLVDHLHAESNLELEQKLQRM
ncbi:hypothetical protein PG984_005640 [Apiospora sp. TS-2023a]